MKKIQFIFVLVLISFRMSAVITVDNIEYVSNGTSVSVANGKNCSGVITIPAMVNSLPVVAINDNAFSQCTGLTSITLPSSITWIHDNAFSGCSGLTSIILPLSLVNIGTRAFQNCMALTSITLPNSVKTIYDFAFKGCTGLTSVRIPPSVSTAFAAFIGCPALIDVDPASPYYASVDGSLYSKNVTVLYHCPSSLVKDVFEVPPTVLEIHSDAFYDCATLNTIAIPATVGSIGSYVFDGCPALIDVNSDNKSFSSKDGILYSKGFKELLHCPNSLIGQITIPLSVTSIRWRAFVDCKGLTSMLIPDSVTTIVESAFSGCSGLTWLSIPSSVSVIQNYAFSGCTGLTAVYSRILNPIGLESYVFNNVDVENCILYVPIGKTNLYKANSGWKDFKNIVEIPVTGSVFEADGLYWKLLDNNNVELSGRSTFAGTEIPQHINQLGAEYQVASLGNSAFEYYSGFTNIVVPSAVTSIGSFTFNSCPNLNKIQLPSGLDTIGNYAFNGCTSLSEISVLSEIPPALGTNVFDLVDKSGCRLLVPSGSLSAYTSAFQWKDFLQIVELNTTELESSSGPYPNPATSFVNLDLSADNIPMILKIYDTQGREMYKTDVFDEHFKLDVSAYPSGIYNIQGTFRINQEIRLGKFIKR